MNRLKKRMTGLLTRTNTAPTQAPKTRAPKTLALMALHGLLRAAAVAGEIDEPVFYVHLNTLPTVWATRPAPNGLSGADIWAAACEELNLYAPNTLTVTLLEAVALLALASAHPQWAAAGPYASLTFRRMDTAQAVAPCPLLLTSAAYESTPTPIYKAI